MALAVLGLATAVRAAVTAFDPDLVSGEDAAMVAEQLGLTEKACDAARARAEPRAVHAADALVAMLRGEGLDMQSCIGMAIEPAPAGVDGTGRATKVDPATSAPP